MNAQDFEAYADLKRFNTTVADAWDAALSEAILGVGRSPEGLILLDYGCGDGKYFAHLQGRGFSAHNLHGVDVSKARVERCRQIGWDNTRVLVPGQALPFDDASVDLINFMEVIEHIPADEGERVASELRRVLRPDGLLMISTPNYPIKRVYDICDAFLHRKWARLRDDPTHVTLFTDSRLRKLLGRHFSSLQPRPFKQGFLHKRFPHPFFLHKLFFLCRP